MTYTMYTVYAYDITMYSSGGRVVSHRTYIYRYGTYECNKYGWLCTYRWKRESANGRSIIITAINIYVFFYVLRLYIMHAYCSDHHRAYAIRALSLYYKVKDRLESLWYMFRGAIQTNNNRREECIENISTIILIIVYYNCCDIVYCSRWMEYSLRENYSTK